MTGRGLLLALAVAAVPSAPAVTQSAPPVSFDEPSWMWRWSPIVPLADLRRTLPGRDFPVTSLASRPAPHVGLFWTAGVPGALPAEAGGDWAEYRLVQSGRSGEFRRPLDPGREAHSAGGALAWGTLGGRGAGIGRVALDRGSFGSNAYADIQEPYASEPFAVGDTVGDDTGRTAVRLEGGGGWRVGALGVGLAAGYHQQETRTIASAVPRQYRHTNPGLTAGVSFDVAGPALRLALLGRWQREVDQIWIYTVAASSRVYPFSGYEDPVPRELVSTIYNRRFERTARAAGAAAAGTVLGAEWVVHARVESRDVAHFRADVPDPVTDEWMADGWMLGAALQRAFPRQHLLVTLDGYYQTLAGESRSGEFEGVPFAAEERRWTATGEVRLVPTSGWQAAVQVAVARERRERTDGLAGVHSDLAAWQPAVMLSLMRGLGPVGIAVGGAHSEFNPSGAGPVRYEMGPIYQNWIAPELGVYATESKWYAGFAGIRWQARSRLAFIAEGRYDVARPGRTLNNLIAAPIGGEREGWSVTVGIVVAEMGR